MEPSFDLSSLSESLANDALSSASWAEVLEKTLVIMGCVTGTLHRFDPASQKLDLLAHKGIPSELMSKVTSIPLGKGIAGAAAERREAVELCNLQTDNSGTALPDAKKTQVAGSLAVPILSGDTLEGVIGVGKYIPYDFSEAEKATLWAVARLLSEAFGRSRN